MKRSISNRCKIISVFYKNDEDKWLGTLLIMHLRQPLHDTRNELKPVDFSSCKIKISIFSLFSRDLYFTTQKVKPVWVHSGYHVKTALKAKLYKIHFKISNLMTFFRIEFGKWFTFYYFSKGLQSGDVNHIKLKSKHFCWGISRQSI